MRSPLTLILICVVLLPKAALGITVPSLCLVADCSPTPTPSISSAPSISTQPTTYLQLQESYLRAAQERRSSWWFITSIAGGALVVLGSIVSLLVWKRRDRNYEEEEEGGGWFSWLPFWTDNHGSFDEESSWDSDES